MTDETIERHSALGFYNLAEDFFRSAEALSNGAISLRFRELIVLNNFTHAIELALKAYLKASGVPNDDLKSKYGHNLDRMLRAAQSAGLALREHELEVKAVVAWLNELSKAQVFRYFELGSLKLPAQKEVQEASWLLLGAVKPKCFDRHGLSTPKSNSAAL